MKKVLSHKLLSFKLDDIKRRASLIIDLYESTITYCNKCKNYYSSKNSSYDDHEKNLDNLKDNLREVEELTRHIRDDVWDYNQESKETFTFDYVHRSRNDLVILSDLIDSKEYEKALDFFYGLLKYKGLNFSKDLFNIIGFPYAYGYMCDMEHDYGDEDTVFSSMYNFLSEDKIYVLDLFNKSICRCESQEMDKDQAFNAVYFYSHIFSRFADTDSLITFCENVPITLTNTAILVSGVLLELNINYEGQKERNKDILNRLKNIKNLPPIFISRIGAYVGRT